MQIGNIFSQIQNAISNDNTAVSSPASNVRTGTADTSMLSRGTVFEGTVTKDANGQLSISLSNGQTLNASLDAGVSVKVGEPLFFQVLGQNESNQTQIRLYQGQVTNNATISNALNAAGLAVSAKTVSMVDSMMANQMSIDRNSLLSMAHTVGDFPGTTVNTLVDMSKLGIPITRENIAQFENYANDNAQVISRMESVIDELPKLLSSGDLNKDAAAALTRDIIGIFKDTGLNGEALASDGAPNPEALLNDSGESTGDETDKLQNTPDLNVVLNPAGENTGKEADITAENLVLGQDSAEAKAEVKIATMTEGENPEANPGAIKDAEYIPSRQSLESVNLLERPVNEYISSDDMKQLSQTLSQIADKSGIAASLLDENGNISGNVTGAKLMNAIWDMLKTPDSFDAKSLQNLLSNTGFKTTLSNIMQRQWMVSPKDVATPGRISDLYERLNEQAGRFEEALAKANTPQTDALAKQITDLKDNISFMNEINQNFTYVQIPLRMLNQNANADLYVYSNKKHMNDDGELSAFLHLDLDNLGSTDVSVKMKDKNVSTNFFMEDEAALDLIEEHIDELTARLNDKGYNCTVTVSNDSKDVDFVDDFLKQGQSVGSLHRYSFDVMA